MNSYISYISLIGYLPVLLMDLAVSAVHTGTAFYSSKLGASSTAWGTIIAVKGIVYVLFSIIFGRVSDKVNRSWMLIIASGATALIYILIPQCKTFSQLAILFPMAGLAQAMFWPVFEAWLTEKHDKGDLINRLAMFNIFWSIGGTAGPFAAGHITKLDFFAPFYLAFIVGLANVLILLIQPKSSERILFGQSVEQGFFNPEKLEKSDQIQGRKYLHIAWIANFGSWFVLGVLRYLTPKLMLDAGFSTGYFGNLMFVLGAVQTLMFLFLGLEVAKSWHYKLLPLLIFQSLGFIAFILIWLIMDPLVWSICFGVVGSTVAMTYFSSMYYGLHRYTDVGNKSGIHEAILGSGVLLGPFFGGMMADLIGNKTPYLFCALIIAICAITEVWMIKRET